MIRMGEAKGKIFNCLVVAAVVILAAVAGTVLCAQGNDYPPGPEPKDIKIVDVDPSSIPADGMSEATITARATNGTDASNNYKLKFEIVAQPGDDAYLTTSEWDDHNSGPLVGNTTNINGYAYAKLKAGTTVGQVEIEVYRIKGSDISDTAIIFLTEPGGKPDLKVTELRANCGELFANASNIINATIDNIGTNASGAFNVSFDTGSFSKEVRVNDLAVNGTTIVSVTDPTQRHAGESVTISVTVDCDSEETTEDNNAISIVKEVVNNGYKGKSVAGLPSLVLLEHQKIRGNLVYTVGNSSKVELEPANTTTTGFNITIPDSASLKTARLYVYWYDSYSSTEHGDADLTVVIEGHSFTTPDAMYTDEKGFGSYNYPKGTYVYDVSSAISGTGTYAAVMENGADNTSTVLTGQMLLVVYEEGSEPEREYWITEGCDLLMANSKYCVSPGEAIANVTLEGEIANATNKSARLITVVAQGNEQGTDLTFNEQVWEDVWQDYAGNSKLCIDDRSVTPAASDNVVGFRDTGTMGMQASNAILVVSSTTSRTFELPITKGWNLISIPLDMGNTSIDAVFPDANDGDVLFSYNGSWITTTYYSGYGWYGDFETIELDKGYWYGANSAYTTTIEGTEAGTRTVPIATGWNLIGYTGQNEAGLNNIIPNANDSDVLFAYDEGWVTATYYSDYGWYGDLNKMQPGKGYWYGATEAFTWEY